MHGDPACHCLRVQPSTASGSANRNCSLVAWPGVAPSATVQCLPLDYGSHCAPWDTNLPPVCELPQPDPPAFCQQSFCFVNASACRNSQVSMSRSSLFDDSFYSYETCGSSDSWSDFRIESALRGRVLRASLPATWQDPYAFGYDGNGDLLPDWTNGMEIVGERLGIFPEFLSAVAQVAGFTIEWDDISTGSRTELGGWSGCMNDVCQGNLDVCVQAMYATPERERLSLFTIPIGYDQAYMVIPKPIIKRDLMDDAKPFKPFSSRLWLVLIGVSMIVGIANCHLEVRAAALLLPPVSHRAVILTN